MPDRAARAAAQWAVQRPDMDMLPMEVLGRLNEASQLVVRERQAPLFARYGLQHGEFDALATLRQALGAASKAGQLVSVAGDAGIGGLDCCYRCGVRVACGAARNNAAVAHLSASRAQCAGRRPSRV